MPRRNCRHGRPGVTCHACSAARLADLYSAAFRDRDADAMQHVYEACLRDPWLADALDTVTAGIVEIDVPGDHGRMTLRERHELISYHTQT